MKILAKKILSYIRQALVEVKKMIMQKRIKFILKQIGMLFSVICLICFCGLGTGCKEKTEESYHAEMGVEINTY